MNEEIMNKLEELFKQVPDIEKNWGMTPLEAAQITYCDEEVMYSHILHGIAYNAIMAIYSESYNRLGCNIRFDGEKFIDEIAEIYKISPYAYREAEYTDLSNQTSITLPDGRVMPINQHLLQKKD